VNDLNQYTDSIFFQNALNSLEEQLAIIDRDGFIIFVNDSWKQFGLQNGFTTEHQWHGINYLEAIQSNAPYDDSDVTRVQEGIRSVILGKISNFEFEYPCHSPTEKRWFILRMSPVKGVQESVFLLTHQNITRRVLAEQAILHSSLHDPLTGLANRRRFDHFLTNEWRRCHRENSPICVLMIDIDHFKKYNDEKGHLEGDQCLKSMAEGIRTNVTRGSDISSRFGGDEFAVVLGATPLAGGMQVAKRILNAIRRLNISLLSGQPVSASIGLACVNPGTIESDDILALIRQADSALYKAKSEGKDRIESI